MKTQTFPESAAGHTAVNVVLFCGGRGSATLIRELLRWQNIELTLLVNAYDDGLSTGALRRFIPGMLGPSDFRKNLSYLLDLYSDPQYALQQILEFRLPMNFDAEALQGLRQFAEGNGTDSVIELLRQMFLRLGTDLSTLIQTPLKTVLDYADSCSSPFDFRDCAVGNLIFAGTYLRCDRSFNAAAKELSRIVGSQAVLVNVCKGENRILAALKEDGELLSCEAEIVGKQSSVPIRHTFFVEQLITPEAWAAVADRPIEEKEAWLRAREAPAEMSPEAALALAKADVIIYGPGTQHSSLLPSYTITSEALKTAQAPVKAMVLNLEPDNDIQGLSANDLVDNLLRYAGDPENTHQVLTHVLFNHPSPDQSDALRFDPDCVNASGIYKGAQVIEGNFRNKARGKVHNGHTMVREVLHLWETVDELGHKPSIDIFIDLYRRAPAITSLLEEFLEIDWEDYFSRVRLLVAGPTVSEVKVPEYITIEEKHLEGDFPEVDIFTQWLASGDSDYLVTMTGDGEYRFRDVMLGMRLMDQSAFGAIYGSRTQSRRQHKTSLRAAYGEHSILFFIGAISAFVFSTLSALRLGVIFSDPLTGFRIYRRRQIASLRNLSIHGRLTPTFITRLLVRSGVEIAEIPVSYRTLAGFTDPWWRLRRGFLNLFGMLKLARS